MGLVQWWAVLEPHAPSLRICQILRVGKVYLLHMSAKNNASGKLQMDTRPKIVSWAHESLRIRILLAQPWDVRNVSARDLPRPTLRSWNFSKPRGGFNWGKASQVELKTPQRLGSSDFLPLFFGRNDRETTWKKHFFSHCVWLLFLNFIIFQFSIASTWKPNKNLQP